MRSKKNVCGTGNQIFVADPNRVGERNVLVRFADQ